MIRRAIRDLVSVKDSREEIGEDEINQLIFLGNVSELELERICKFIQKKDSEKLPILIEPMSKNEEIFVRNFIEKVSQSVKFFNFSPKTIIKDLINKEDKNSLINCYEKGENIVLNIQNFNSKECERVLELILKVITKEEINLSEFDSNNKSVIKKNNNFSVAVVQKNSFIKLKPPYSNIYCRFSDLFKHFRFVTFETLSNWISCLETTNQEKKLLNLLKNKKSELEEETLKYNLKKKQEEEKLKAIQIKIKEEETLKYELKKKQEEEKLKSRVGDLFRNETVGFGDNFSEKKEENSENSQNLYKILPRFRLYFDINKKESIEFLKNGGLEKLKNQIAEVIPIEDFQITNLRIGSIDLELTYTSQQVKDYLQKIITGGDTKDFERNFKNLAKEFSKKSFEVFNKKDLKASAQTFYLDKSKKEEVKQCLEESSKCGLRQTIDNLEKEIIKEVLERETNIKKNVSNIEKAINNMISFNKYNQKFKEEFEEAKKDSIFEYVVDSLPIIFKDSQQYEKAKAECENCQTKILFHGTGADPVAAIITSQFRFNDGLMGEGVYLSDMLDLVRFYSLDRGKPGESFYVVGSEIFFDKTKAVRIDKYTRGQSKKTEKNGIHYGISEGHGGCMISDSEVESFKNELVGREYMISFPEQINPIYGLKLKRNEYCIIWRDPNFDENNEFREYIEKLKKFIEEEVGYNLYIETSTESALRLVKKKIYNKIILVSNIGPDLGGKHFVEEAREIIGCNAYTLFSSYSEHHIEWVKDFENALFSNERGISEEFLKDFSIDGLNKLKIKAEVQYCPYKDPKYAEHIKNCKDTNCSDDAHRKKCKFTDSTDVKEHDKCKFRDFTEVNYVHYVESGDINELEDCEGFELNKHKFLPNP